MKKLEKFGKTVDMFFLNPFQKFSHWSQKTLGLTNFWWARFCLILFLALVALLYGLYCHQVMHDKDKVFSAWSIVIVVLIFLIGAVFWLICNLIERNCDNNLHRGTGNVFTSHLLGFRLIFLFFSIYSNARFIAMLISIAVMNYNYLDIKSILGLFCIWFIFGGFMSLPCAFLYFVSCSPLPPGQSKIKAKAKELKEKVSGFLSPQPDATPA